MNIGIVTPTLNAGKFIKYTLDSVDLLRAKGAKHLIVDSGSTDKTVNVAKSQMLECLYCPPGSMYKAINLGIENLNYEWVSYINSDDLMHAYSLIDIPDCYLDEYDVIYGDIDFIDENGCFVDQWRSATPRMLKGLFASGIMPMPQPGAIFKKTLWNKLGGFDTNYKYCADFDFFLRAYQSGAKFGYYQRTPLASFRVHSEQISQNYREVMLAEVRHSIKVNSLRANLYEKLLAKFEVKVRNVSSYLVRFIRRRRFKG